MKIGLVISNTPGYSETFFRSKITGLTAAGAEVIVFASQKDQSFNLCKVVSPPPVKKHKLLQSYIMLFRLLALFVKVPISATRFYRLERNSGRDLRQTLENLYLNSHILPYHLDWLHFGFATMALRHENAASAIGAKMAVSLRGFDVAIYPLKHPGCYDLLWKRVDKVHTISDDLLVLAYINRLSHSVSVKKITPAINVNQFSRKAPPTERFNNPLRILTVARMNWKKGLEYTLEALAMLKKEGISFQYTIVGEGEEYERLAFAAHQLGISGQVEFRGKLSHEKVKKEMEQADIYIQYSISEGFCNAVLEAQAMELFCIVSDAEGLSENVLHEITGWVVPKRQPQKLFQQILEVIHKSSLDLLEIREKSKERIRHEFNLEKQQFEFVQFYQD